MVKNILSSWIRNLGFFAAILVIQAPVLFAQGVVLGAGNGSAAPGAMVEIPLQLTTQTGAPPTAAGAIVSFDHTKLTYVSARKGDPQVIGAKTLQKPAVQANGDVKLLLLSIGDMDPIGNGNWAYVTFTLSGQFATTPVNLNTCESLDGQLMPLPTSCSATPGIITEIGGAPPVLTITKMHSGNFMAGQMGAPYSVTVGNTGTSSTSGAVTVTETVPSGLTLVSMAGTGWTCPAGGTTCTRSDSLAAGASYPPIAVAVNVAATATTPQINAVSASGGGSASATAMDPTTIMPPPLPPLRVPRSLLKVF